MTSSYYPILMKLTGRLCLVVGGGNVAGRKASSLLESGASVRLVAPEISDGVKKLAEAGAIELINEPFKAEHLKGVCLAIASTDDEDVNRAVYNEAVALSIPVNVVDIPELCSFIVPSVARRGDLIISVSTSGKSPAVSKMIRRHLEKEFGEEYAVFVEMMGEARKKTMASVNDQKQREKIFNELVESDMLDRIRKGDIQGAKRLVEEIVGT